jgi:hypothetical protein
MKLLGIDLSNKEFDILMCEQAKGKELKVVDDKVVAVERTLTEKEKAQMRISELIQMLYDTDHHALKYAEGIISADNYLAMRDLRQSWRDEINALEVQYAIDSKQLQKGVQ